MGFVKKVEDTNIVILTLFTTFAWSYIMFKYQHNLTFYNVLTQYISNTNIMTNYIKCFISLLNDVISRQIRLITVGSP